MLIKFDHKTKILVIGSVIGATIGIAASYILLKKVDSNEASSALTRGQGIKLGLGVIGLLKLLSDFSDDNV